MEPLSGFYPVEEDVVRTLSRSVAVDDDDMVAIHVVQSLTAHIYETYGQVVEGVEHEHSQRSGEAGYGNPVVDDELPDGMEVSAYVLGHDMEGTTLHQDSVQVFQMGIERERAMCGHAVVSGHSCDVTEVLYEVPQIGLAYHYALGLSRRAGGVDHVR